MTSTIVHIMRHGEVHNPEGILYERLPDYHLSELGKEMVQISANFLLESKANITTIFTSPLDRAQESAEPAAAAFGLPINKEELLIESSSVFAGKKISAYSSFWFNPCHFIKLYNPYKPSWGEPYKHIALRMVKAVAKARRQAYGAEALLVSHQLPIWCLRLFIERRSLPHLPFSRQCGLASITSLVFSEAKLVGWSYNEPAGKLIAEAQDITPGTTSAGNI